MCAKNGQPVTYLIYFLLAIWMVFDIQTAAATENHPEGAQVQLNLNFKSDLNSNLQEAFRKEFRCNQQYQWIPVSVEIDEIGNSHSRYLQYFENIPVKGAILIVHKELSGKATVSGTYVKIETLILNKYLSETEILQALNIRNQSNAQLIWVYEEGSKSYIKAYEINDNDYHKVLIAAASDGKLVAVSDHNCYADVNGSAVTAYYGTQQIATNFDQINYTLKTASRGKGIETFNLNGNNNYLSKTEFIDQDNHWDQSVPATERFATDAHYCAVAYYDFLQHKFSRNSIDNNGQKLISYLNYGSGLLNAFWNGSAVVYGGGNASGTPLTTLDIAGHEFTHGLIQKTANLNYAGQPGTINESLADMLGTALEFYADSLNANWIIGDQSGNILRSLSEPSLYNQPDTYLGDHWYYGTGDNGGVHINSGFMNKWFYLLAEGGQGVNDFGTSYQVTGIGVDEATRIVYNTMIAYLVPSSDYVDFKNATIQSAALIFGTCSPQYLSVLQCWKAVGLGQGINEPLLLEAPVNNTICRGETITLKAIGLPGSVYTWYNDSIQISSGLPSEISVANGGSWMVSENRCGVILNSEIVEVIVNDLPIVSTVNLSTCSEEMVTL